MRIPTIHGYIDRRILVNYTAEPEVVSRIIPAPFRPKNYRGRAIIGVCLIRLKHIKPKGLPDMMGISSRMLLTGSPWSGMKMERLRKVYSFHAEILPYGLMHWWEAGYFRASIIWRSLIFENLDNASSFFKNGNVGYSPCDTGFDGLNLNVFNWNVKPLCVANTRSSFFENETIFPGGSVVFDNALLMLNAEHEWRSISSK